MPRLCAVLLLAGVAVAMLPRRRPIVVQARHLPDTWTLADGTVLYLSPTVH